MEQSGGADKITLVLMGKNSNDKSMIGNTILKADRFSAGQDTWTRVEEKVDHQTICIINTPHLFHKANLERETDLIEEINPLYPGPRAFILVVHDTRLLQEEMEMFSQMKARYGEKMVENTIVVLVNSQRKQPVDLIYDRADLSLKKLLDECRQRFCVHTKDAEGKDNTLTNQVLENWKRIHEKRPNESRNSTPAAEAFYEDIDAYIQMKEIPEKSKEQTKQKSEEECKISVVLLGKNSKRKCLIGNLILGKDRFRSEKASCEKIVETVDGQKVCIINTPDHFHKPKTTNPDSDGMEELKPSFTGPRVFLLIFKNKLISEDEMNMFIELKKKLGPTMVATTVVLIKRDKKSSSNSMQRPIDLKSGYDAILNECGNRTSVYDKHMKNTELIEDLKKHIESMQKNQTSESTTVRARHEYMEIRPTSNEAVNVHQPKPMTIVLLGQTGSGKSATGNTILRKNHFKSHASSLPVTTECQAAEETVFETRLRVIDTPDFFSEDLKNKEEQIKKCRELIRPGPDVYLLVMQLGRFTDGEREVLPHLKNVFGEDVNLKTVILFTGKEKLKNRTLIDYVNGCDKELQELIETCQSRYHAFNNNEKSHQQLKKLLEMISDMKGNTGMVNHHRHKNNCRIL